MYFFEYEEETALTSCLFLVLDSQPTATKLFQSLPFRSGTVFRSTSHLLCHFPSSALTWRHTSSNCVIHKTFVVPAKWHCHFGHVKCSTYLLTYLMLGMLSAVQWWIAEDWHINRLCVGICRHQGGQRTCCGSTFSHRGSLLSLRKSMRRKPRSSTAEWGGNDFQFLFLCLPVYMYVSGYLHRKIPMVFPSVICESWRGSIERGKDCQGNTLDCLCLDPTSTSVWMIG